MYELRVPFLCKDIELLIFSAFFINGLVSTDLSCTLMELPIFRSRENIAKLLQLSVYLFFLEMY